MGYIVEGQWLGIHPEAARLLGTRTLEDVRILMEAEAIASRTRNRRAQRASGDRTAEPDRVTVLPDEEATAFREQQIAAVQKFAVAHRAER